MTGTGAPRIEVFADINCPFTHVGLRRLVEARRVRGSSATVRVRAWPLEWINAASLSVEVAAREIAGLRASVAPDLFGGFDPRTFRGSSLPAFGLVAAAYAIDDHVGETVSLAVRDALFEEGRQISDPHVVVEIGERFDVVPLDADATARAVTSDWNRGKALGVRGSPHFFVGGRDWFCPSLQIRHDDGGFQIDVAEDSMRDFYASALG